MAELDDDIARIARLRGHDPALVARKAQEIEGETAIRALERMPALFRVADPAVELRTLDRLPRASRLLIVSSPVNISAAVYADMLLDLDGDERRLIESVQRAIVAQLRVQAIRHFGPEHPGARIEE